MQQCKVVIASLLSLLLPGQHKYTHLWRVQAMRSRMQAAHALWHMQQAVGVYMSTARQAEAAACIASACFIGRVFFACSWGAGSMCASVC